MASPHRGGKWRKYQRIAYRRRNGPLCLGQMLIHSQILDKQGS